MTKEKTPKKKNGKVEKRTIRCRNCFMVDTYTVDEKRCRHCGAELFSIDEV